MGIFSTGRRSGPRKFDYEPRHYDPEKDEKLKRRMRIRSRTRRGNSPGLLYLGVMLILVVAIYYAL
jgi:hypothetical protein